MLLGKTICEVSTARHFGCIDDTALERARRHETRELRLLLERHRYRLDERVLTSQDSCVEFETVPALQVTPKASQIRTGKSLRGKDAPASAWDSPVSRK